MGARGPLFLLLTLTVLQAAGAPPGPHALQSGPGYDWYLEEGSVTVTLNSSGAAREEWFMRYLNNVRDATYAEGMSLLGAPHRADEVIESYFTNPDVGRLRTRVSYIVHEGVRKAVIKTPVRFTWRKGTTGTFEIVSVIYDYAREVSEGVWEVSVDPWYPGGVFVEELSYTFVLPPGAGLISASPSGYDRVDAGGRIALRWSWSQTEGHPGIEIKYSLPPPPPTTAPPPPTTAPPPPPTTSAPTAAPPTLTPTTAPPTTTSSPPPRHAWALAYALVGAAASSALMAAALLARGRRRPGGQPEVPRPPAPPPSPAPEPKTEVYDREETEVYDEG